MFRLERPERERDKTIPPSIVMIIIGVMTETPIGSLFLSGAVPGVMLGVGLVGMSLYLSIKRGYPRSDRRASLGEIVRDLAAELGQNPRIARIYADMDRTRLKTGLAAGKVQQFDHPEALTAAAIDRSAHIVAQMGVEPIIQALKGGADIIIAGRAYDPAVFAALPILEGFDPALAFHMGKVLECGAYACEPSSAADGMLATLREDHFVLEPLSPEMRCTPVSVAAETMYEKESPVHFHFPGGMIDLSETRFEALSDREVRVSGTSFTKAETYTIKLEGAAHVGYRSLFTAGARDPIFIERLDEIIAKTHERLRERVNHPPEDYTFIVRVYGRDGVMGANEPVRDIASHEIGIVGEAVAKTQDIAHEIASYAHGVMLHYNYTGRKTTAGNLAFPYSPSDFDVGEVYEFNIYHLLELDDPNEVFSVKFETVDTVPLPEAV